MKACINCNETKPLSGYYKHGQMADGHLNKCSDCCKAQARERHHRKALDPSWVRAERARGREKHRRLGYQDQSHPDQIRARNLSQRVPCPDGMERHHWSYAPENAKDIIPLTPSAHRRVHQHMVYEASRQCYRAASGVLLSTRQLHIRYVHAVLAGYATVETAPPF